MRISDWSSDVCSSDLQELLFRVGEAVGLLQRALAQADEVEDLERPADVRAFLCRDGERSEVDVVQLVAELVREGHEDILENGHPAEQLQVLERAGAAGMNDPVRDRKSTRLNSSQ